MILEIFESMVEHLEDDSIELSYVRSDNIEVVLTIYKNDSKVIVKILHQKKVVSLVKLFKCEPFKVLNINKKCFEIIENLQNYKKVRYFFGLDEVPILSIDTDYVDVRNLA